jgi:hypothetical protein
MAGKCEGCLFAGDTGGCFKPIIISQVKPVYAGKVKALLFLDHELSRIDKIHCLKKYDGQLSFTLAEQRVNALDDFEVCLKRRADWCNEQPISMLRRYQAKAGAGRMIRMHCCWVSCPDKVCSLRRRGRHCRKQKKITDFKPMEA